MVKLLHLLGLGALAFGAYYIAKKKETAAGVAAITEDVYQTAAGPITLSWVGNVQTEADVAATQSKINAISAALRPGSGVEDAVNSLPEDLTPMQRALNLIAIGQSAAVGLQPGYREAESFGLSDAELKARGIRVGW